MNYSFVNKSKLDNLIPSNNNNNNNYDNNNYDNNNNDNNKINPYNLNEYKPINYNWTDYSQNKNNWATENSIQKSLLKGIYEPTPVGEIYFSQQNINRIQKMIKYELFVRTNGKYKLEIDQNESDLLIVMRDIYITCGKNMPYKVIHQVKELNNRTIEKILPDMISLIKQDDEYIKQLDKPIDPIPLPVCVNSKGRLGLPSVTTTFF